MRAGEFLKKLEQDADYQKMRQQKEEELQKRVAQMRIIEKDFINEIHLSGYLEINGTGDLLKFKKINFELSSFLLNWIPKMDNTHGSKERLVRALVMAEKPFDGRILTELFDDTKSSFFLKWAIGNTIASAKIENIADWLEKKLTGLHLGKEHEMLVYAIIKHFKYEKASMLLRKLFLTFPLQAAGALSMIGKESDLKFLEDAAAKYDGVGKAEINKSLKKLIKKLTK